MPTHGAQTPLRLVIVTCRILFGCTFDEIERKTKRENLGVILKILWPANSPDLHPVEDVWDYEKSQLAPKWKELRGAGKTVQERARKEIANMWRSEEILVKTREITNGQNKFRA